MRHIKIMYAKSYHIDVSTVLVCCSFLVPYYLERQYTTIKDNNDIEMKKCWTQPKNVKTRLNTTPLLTGYVCMVFNGIPTCAMVPILQISIPSDVLKDCYVTLQLTADSVAKWFMKKIIKQNINSLLHTKNRTQWIRNINWNQCFP